MLCQEPAQQIAATGDREADRERKLGAERAVIHWRMFLFCPRERSPAGEGNDKGGCRKPTGTLFGICPLPKAVSLEVSLRCSAIKLPYLLAPPEGEIDATPNALIAEGADWRFLNELKRELKA